MSIGREELVLLTDSAGAECEDFIAWLHKPLLVFPYGCSYRRRLEELLAGEGIVPSQMIEFTSLAAIIASLSAGLGISLFPASAVHTFLAGRTLSAHKIPEPYRTVDIRFVWRKTPWDNKTLTAFVNTITANL